MTESGYPEAELLTNRASLLLCGGTAADRRAWVDEAAAAFGRGAPVHEVTDEDSLTVALREPQALVFIPDTAAIGEGAQATIVRCLQEREERPKIVLGLSTSASTAQQRGVLRDDLLFRLKHAQVNLADEDTRQSIKARRARAASKASARSKNAGAEKRPRRAR